MPNKDILNSQLFMQSNAALGDPTDNEVWSRNTMDLYNKPHSTGWPIIHFAASWL